MDRQRLHPQEVVELPTCAALLIRWHGARARVWRYHASLSRLALLVHQASTPTRSFILADGCKHIHGPFGWTKNTLEIEEGIDDHALPIIELTDRGGDFQLTCRSLSVLVLDNDEFEFDG